MKLALVAAFLSVAVPAGAQRIPVDGLPSAALEARGGRTVLRRPGGGAVPLGRDGPCAPCALREARLLGERPGAALILLVTYASRPGTPGGLCGAGEEEVLHVVRLRPRPREAVVLRLTSCWSNVEAAGAASWDGRLGLLLAERWTPDSGGAPERRNAGRGTSAGTGAWPPSRRPEARSDAPPAVSSQRRVAKGTSRRWTKRSPSMR